MPEIKWYPFKLNDGGKRAVLFVRISPSYSPSHYVWQTREILVRVNCENERTDLQTIEDLFERRKRFQNESHSIYAASWNSKLIETEAPVFETIVVHLNFAKGIVSFSKENDDAFYKIASEVMRLNEQKPYPITCNLKAEILKGR